jgi:hypothetical protein
LAKVKAVKSPEMKSGRKFSAIACRATAWQMWTRLLARSKRTAARPALPDDLRDAAARRMLFRSV